MLKIRPHIRMPLNSQKKENAIEVFEERTTLLSYVQSLLLSQL